MNSKQRRQQRRKISKLISAKLERLSIDSCPDKLSDLTNLEVLIKDFSRPNIHGVMYRTENLPYLVKKFKERLPVGCELEQQIHDPKFSLTINSDRVVAMIQSVEYDETTKKLTGEIVPVSSKVYPGYKSLLTDLDENKVFFGLRGIARSGRSDQLTLVEILTFDLRFNWKHKQFNC